MKKMYLLAVLAVLSFSAHGSELFIRVLRTGMFSATASNQTQYNNTNIFRFFDLPNGAVSIQISEQQTGILIFNSFVTIQPNQRVVAELDGYGNLNVIQTIPVTATNWYTSTPITVYSPNPYPPNGNNLPNSGYPNNGTYMNNDAGFQQFLSFLDKETFDDKKLSEAKNYASKTRLSSQQIVDVAKKFTFDSGRLEWAKSAYASCYDPANYFLLKSTFTFSSNYSALEDFIAGK